VRDGEVQMKIRHPKNTNGRTVMALNSILEMVNL